MIFGKKHPAFTFLLLLAIADDVVGLAIIALFYPDPELPVNPRWLSLVFVAVAVAWILNKHKVRSYWAYLLTGILSWAGLHEANMHPSLALIFIIPFIPHETEPGKERCQTELDRFESDFKPIVDYGLFFLRPQQRRRRLFQHFGTDADRFRFPSCRQNFRHLPDGQNCRSV